MNPHADGIWAWLEHKAPNFPAFLYGCTSGALGLAAFGFLLLLFLAQHAVAGMYVGALVAACAAGYSFGQKRKTGVTRGAMLQALLLGALVGLAAYLGLDNAADRFPYASPGLFDLSTLVIGGLAASFAGLRLRQRFEEIG
ncbi:hypothetical protein [Desulfohalovibrio reitneri]|uniref:hypothetical protein n=1 Tax=Desulfohalovibrio reitneri TaxID=1307759 RepID=UPI0004A70D41|nr:hypothetical protein [Desulfohalovibrio reitneri]